MATNYTLKAGSTLAVTANEGRVHVYSGDNGSESAFTRSAVSFGPYFVDRTFLVDGDATVTTARDTTPTNSYIYAHDGAPDDAVQATLSLNPTGDDNALTATARVYGEEGNSISIAYVDPGADSALSVSVFRQAITVTLAYAEAAITSTAAEVKAAIEAYWEANQLVSLVIDTADSGAGDDGSGVVTALAAAALTGGAGTAIGRVQPGGLLIDTSTGKQYRNVGTLAVPVWVSPQDLHLYGSGAPVDYTDGSPPATGEGTAYPGAIYTDTANGNVYRNSGTRAEPAWTQIADVTP